jgi:hypothetical protein
MPLDDNPLLPEQPAEAPAPAQPPRAVPEKIVARSEALREQRAEMARMTAELRQLYQSTRQQHGQEATALRRTTERLEQILAQREQELAEARQRAEAAEAQLQEMEQLQQQLILQSQAALDEQRGELVRLMAELREVCQAGAASAGPLAGPETETVPDETLRQALHERDRKLAEGEPASAVAHPHETENRIKQLEALLAEALQKAHEAESRLEPLQNLPAEVAALERQLEQKASQISQLEARVRRSPGSSVDDAEIAAYEAELAEYHRQLEADRAALNEEIRQLRARNVELSETSRRAELERARERAQLYGETQIDRAFADLALRQHERSHINKLVPILRMRPQNSVAANTKVGWTTTSDQQQ